MAKEKSKTIDLREKIAVRATQKNPYMKTGEVVEVHPIAANEGIKIGHYELVKEEKKTKA